jgi:hypothetical protein
MEMYLEILAEDRWPAEDEQSGVKYTDGGSQCTGEETSHYRARDRRKRQVYIQW